jgi:hypothetical protein
VLVDADTQFRREGQEAGLLSHLYRYSVAYLQRSKWQAKVVQGGRLSTAYCKENIMP